MKRISLFALSAIVTTSAIAKVGEVDFALEKGQLSYETMLTISRNFDRTDGTENMNRVGTSAHTFSYSPISDLVLDTTLTYLKLLYIEENGTENKNITQKGLEDVQVGGSYALGSLGLGATLALSPKESESKINGSKVESNAFSGGHSLSLSATYDFIPSEKIVLQPEITLTHFAKREEVQITDGSKETTKFKPRTDYSLGVNGQYLFSDTITFQAAFAVAALGKDKEDAASGEVTRSFYTTASSIATNYYLKKEMFVGGELACEREEDHGNTKDTTVRSATLKFGVAF